MQTVPPLLPLGSCCMRSLKHWRVYPYGGYSIVLNVLQYVLWDREYRGHKANDMSSCLKVPDFLVFYVKQFITFIFFLALFSLIFYLHLIVYFCFPFCFWNTNKYKKNKNEAEEHITTLTLSCMACLGPKSYMTLHLQSPIA